MAHPVVSLNSDFGVAANVRSCRVQRENESVRLVAVTRIKAVRVGIHLVLEDAIRGSTRCMADDEHAPTGNIDPDGISLVGGSFGDRLAWTGLGWHPVFPRNALMPPADNANR